MNFLKQQMDGFKWPVWKIIVALFLALLLISLLSTLFKSVVPYSRTIGLSGITNPSTAPHYGGGKMDMAMDGGLSYSESSRMIMPEPYPPIDGYISGNDAENYETKEYNASIETGNLDRDCGIIIGLKGREDVIFENASQSDYYCNYTFKVPNDKASEILKIVESLKPTDLSESTYSIKSQIENYTTEEEILKNKLDTIEATLADAKTSYDSLIKLANNTRDVESLTKIIDSKINTLERLTQDRIDTVGRLDRITKQKGEQLDRLEYTYFYINISEQKYFNGKELKDSWQQAVREFFFNTNTLIQDLTINLISFTLIVVKYAVYVLIVLFIALVGWRNTKKYWQK